MNTLLLIGGSGFFGKSFLDSFERGQLAQWDIGKIIVLARHPEKLRSECPQLLSDRVELLAADIATTTFLPQADIVIHAAATTDAARYTSNAEEEQKNIQLGIRNFCDLVPRFCKDSKIHYVSSGAVYGAQPDGMLLIAEDFSWLPIAQVPANKRVYATAKRDAEQLIVQLGCCGFDVSISRCFAFLGPWLPRDQHFAIGNFLADGLEQRPIHVNARHAVYRSYMYADDMVEWLMSIALHSTRLCPVFNVGSDQAVLLGDLAKQVAALCHAGSSVPSFDGEQVDRYVPSVAKAGRELNLKIKIDLQTALQKTLAAIKTHQDAL